MIKWMVYGGLIMIVGSTFLDLIGAGELLNIEWGGAPIVTGALSKILDIIGGGLLIGGIFRNPRR